MDKCNTCEKEDGAADQHSCPYQEDVQGNDSDYCNCCEDCERECAMAI